MCKLLRECEENLIIINFFDKNRKRAFKLKKNGI